MAISYRGKNVDMIALEKANANKVALGNAHMNTRGDILGRGGIIVKTREDQLKEWQSKVIEEENVSFKDDSENLKIEKEIKEMEQETGIKPKKHNEQKKKPTQGQIIFDDEIENSKTETTNA